MTGGLFLLSCTSGDKKVKLWNRDGTLYKTFSGHDDRVKTLAFSPDGKRLASASLDGTVNVWNVDLDLDIEGLRNYSCIWIGDYLKNNSKLNDRDKKLCD